MSESWEITAMDEIEALRERLVTAETIADETKKLLYEAEARCDRLEKTFQRMPHIEDVRTAMLANGGHEFVQEYCQCDASVGMVPCQYCAIHDVLRRIESAIAAAKEETK